LGPPWGTKSNPRGHPGAPPRPDWDHPGVPKVTLGATLERLRTQTPKNIKKITFRGTFFGYILDISSYFSDACFLTCFVNISPTIFLRQRHPQASISSRFGCLLEHILNNSGKLETTIPCGRGLENQALEGLCFTLFRHFHAQVSGTFYFHASFNDLSAFCAFGPPLEALF
jgi:hypothetical protein